MLYQVVPVVTTVSSRVKRLILVNMYKGLSNRSCIEVYRYYSGLQ